MGPFEVIKMSNITTEKANELFWLGRYVERVYTTCMEFFKGYDRMIDEREVSYPEYCRRVSIPNVYADKEDFLRSYPFDESNPDSIISNRSAPTTTPSCSGTTSAPTRCPTSSWPSTT